MNEIVLLNSKKSFPVGKILCLGRNYPEHAREMRAEIPKIPVVFLKPSSAIITNGEPIILPPISCELHYEVELIVAIGKGGKSIPQNRAFEHILGYGVGLDMTLRDIQSEAKKKGLPWSVSKGFDTSAPISAIVPLEEIVNPSGLKFQCSVNGTVRQRGDASEMIFPVEAIIEYLSKLFTLEAGDLVYTGTPEGVGPVKPGDIIEAELTGYTSIRHPVHSA